MPRFKQPLQGLSRLSDRGGSGGGGSYLETISYLSNNSSSVTIPSGIQSGDLILFFGGANNAATPAIPTGFTDLALVGTNTRLRVAYKISNGSETSISSTNTTIASVVVFRNHGGIGQTVQASESGPSPDIGTIPNLRQGSRVVTGVNNGNFVFPPASISNFTGSLLTSSIGITIDPANEGDVFSGSPYRTNSASVTLNYFSVEVLAA